VVRGTTATGTVTLSAPAPAGGVAVDVRSSKTTAAAVEARVTVPEGATTATFNVTTKQVRRNAAVTITATYAGVRKTARLTVSVR